MKYPEKVQLVDTATQKLKDGHSLVSIAEELKEKGYYQYDVNGVLRSVKNEFNKHHGDAVFQHLMEETFDAHRHEFNFLSDDLVEALKELQIERIIKQSKKEVNKLMRAKADEAIILEKVSNRYFAQEAVQKQIESFKYFNKKVGPAQSAKYIGLGILLLVLGGAAFVVGQIGIALGLIVFGGVNLVKAFSTQAAIDGMNDE